MRFAFPLCCREDFGNLRWIDRRGHVAIDDLELPASGLVCDGGYFSLDNFAVVEFYPNAGAYAVIHRLLLDSFHPGEESLIDCGKGLVSS